MVSIGAKIGLALACFAMFASVYLVPVKKLWRALIVSLALAIGAALVITWIGHLAR